MQTLYSVLRHRFNDRVLYFDLLFDPKAAESDETGFLFKDKSENPPAPLLRMTELSCLTCDERHLVELERKVLPAALGDLEKELLIRKNLKALWNIFVERDHRSIAFFSVKAETPSEVNEVFRRLNTGGMALTQLELVLGKIKATHSNYEERLWALSEKIKQRSGGIHFSSASILQFFHLLTKETIRIDEERLKDKDVQAFVDVLRFEEESDAGPLVELFAGYLKGIFEISHASIVPRWLPMLPIAAYLTTRKRSGHKWRIRELPERDMQLLSQYFILSQFCDWGTQTMVNEFSRQAIDAAKSNQAFPLEEIRKIAIKKNRTGELHEHQLLSQPWLATKILMPSRSYVFHENKPQVDHIFPINLKGEDEAYQSTVDILWNFQPMPAEVNNYKRARHPKEFFLSSDGQKYWSSYDFIPKPSDDLWNSPSAFVADRKQKMLHKLSELYGLHLACST